MPRLTMILGAAVLFTSLFANSFSLVIPEDIAIAIDQGTLNSPEPTTPADDTIASGKLDAVTDSAPEAATPVDDASASGQVGDVLQSSPQPTTPVDATEASHQGDDVAESSPEPATPVDGDSARGQVGDVAQSSPQLTTPVDDAMASIKRDEVVQNLAEPTTPVAESTSNQSNQATPQVNEMNLQINFVTSTESSQTPVPQTNPQTVEIDGLIKMVNNRSAEVFEKLINLGSQDPKAKSDLMTPFREKLGTYVQTLKSYVNGIITAGGKENFHKYECQKFFDDYAVSLVDNTLQKINNAFTEVYRNMSISFGKFSIETKATINYLTDLKRMTLTELDAVERASSIYESYAASTGEFYEKFIIDADGPRIIEEMRPLMDRNINMGLDIIEKTYNCVFDVL